MPPPHVQLNMSVLHRVKKVLEFLKRLERFLVLIRVCSKRTLSIFHGGVT